MILLKSFSPALWRKSTLHQGCGERLFLSTSFPQDWGYGKLHLTGDPKLIHSFLKPYYSYYKKILIKENFRTPFDNGEKTG